MTHSTKSDSSIPTIVLIHGAFANSFTFAPLSAELALRGVRSAAVDLPGHGFEATFPIGYQAPQDRESMTSAPGRLRGVTLADNVEHLAGVLARAKEQGPVIVLAHSRGGITLTATANAHPDLIDHMVYVSAWAPVALETAEYNTEPEMAEVPTATLAAAMVGDPLELGLLRCNFRSSDSDLLEGLHSLFCAEAAPRTSFGPSSTRSNPTRTSTSETPRIVRRRAPGARSTGRTSASARIEACPWRCRIG